MIVPESSRGLNEGGSSAPVTMRRPRPSSRGRSLPGIASTTCVVEFHTLINCTVSRARYGPTTRLQRILSSRRAGAPICSRVSRRGHSASGITARRAAVTPLDIVRRRNGGVRFRRSPECLLQTAFRSAAPRGEPELSVILGHSESPGPLYVGDRLAGVRIASSSHAAPRRSCLDPAPAIALQ